MYNPLQKDNGFVPMEGKRFGKLLVLRQGPIYIDPKKGTRILCWWALCDCGRTKLIRGASMRSGRTGTCGCGIGTLKMRHGLCINGTRTPEYALWMGAKKRARDSGLPFSITVEDVVIPPRCPVFNTELKHTKGPGCRDNSPTLDRLVNILGYVKGNVWVISGKANKAKSNLSLKELKLLVKVLDKKLRSMHE